MDEAIKHGGKREGAGRKATGRKRITTTLTLSPKVIDYLKTKGRTKSDYVEALICADMIKGEA
jgi:hypothetical protein